MRGNVLPHELLELGWCQGGLAKDQQGALVWPTEPSAISWCLVGAGVRAFDVSIPVAMANPEIMRQWNKACRAAMGSAGTIFTPQSWQDAPARTGAEVIQICKKAEADLGLVTG